jgi:hypothetical protein
VHAESHRGAALRVHFHCPSLADGGRSRTRHVPLDFPCLILEGRGIVKHIRNAYRECPHSFERAHGSSQRGWMLAAGLGDLQSFFWRHT